MFNYTGIKKSMSSNVKCKRKWKMSTRPAAYYELLNRRWWTTNSGKIITKQVLGYWHCSPKLLGCHNLSIPPFHRSYWERKKQHFKYIIKQFLPMVLSSFRCVCGDGQNRTEVWGKTLTPYSSQYYKILFKYNICITAFMYNNSPFSLCPNIFCSTKHHKAKSTIMLVFFINFKDYLWNCKKGVCDLDLHIEWPEPASQYYR